MKNKNISLILLGILAVILVCCVGVTVFNNKTEPEAVIDDQNEDNDDSQRTDIITVDGQKYKLNSDIETILFMGVDKDAKTEVESYAGANGQSDSLNLLILDKAAKTGQIMQINRDSMVDVEIYSSAGQRLAYERGQIALQYAYGDKDSRSCQLVTKKVSELLYNIDITDYVALTLDGITEAADSLGGVTITIPEDYTYINPEFQKGKTITLDGAQAESYVRYRDIDELESNLPRMQRQAEFMEALITQLQAEKDLSSYYKIYQNLEPYMETNLTAEEMSELSEYEISMETIEIPGEVIEENGYAEFIVDNEGLQEIVLKTFYKPY